MTKKNVIGWVLWVGMTAIFLWNLLVVRPAQEAEREQRERAYQAESEARNRKIEELRQKYERLLRENKKREAGGN